MKKINHLIVLSIVCCSTLSWAAPGQSNAVEIIRKADDIRSPNKPFRYTVTITEYKAGTSKPVNKQILDVSMRFLKPEGNAPADAKSLVRFVYPAKDKGKIMLSDWYDLWFYTPELRRPIPISRQQRLLGQISNGDVIVTNFEYSYDAKILDEQACGNTTCYRLSLQRKSSDVTWPKVTYLVEKGTYRPFKASYLSQDGKVMKEVTYHNYKSLLGKERPSKIVVKDARQGNGYSVMEYSDLKFESLPVSYFTKEYIQRWAK